MPLVLGVGFTIYTTSDAFAHAAGEDITLQKMASKPKPTFKAGSVAGRHCA